MTKMELGLGIIVFTIFGFLFRDNLLGATQNKLTIGDLINLGVLSSTTDARSREIILVELPSLSYDDVFINEDGVELHVKSNKEEFEKAKIALRRPTLTNFKWRLSRTFYELPQYSYANENGKQWLVNLDDRYLMVPIDKINP